MHQDQELLPEITITEGLALLQVMLMLLEAIRGAEQLQHLQHCLQPEGEVRLLVTPEHHNQVSEPGVREIAQGFLLEPDPAHQAGLIDPQEADQVRADPLRSDQVQVAGVQEQAEVILQVQDPVAQGALVHQVEAVAPEVAQAVDEVAINIAALR